MAILGTVNFVCYISFIFFRMKITLSLPPSINRTYKAGVNRRTGKLIFYKDREVKDWIEEALWEIKKQIHGQKTKGESVYISWFKKGRTIDIDFGIKSVLDLLQKSRIIENDSSVIFLQVQKQKAEKDYCLVEVI